MCLTPRNTFFKLFWLSSIPRNTFLAEYDRLKLGLELQNETFSLMVMISTLASNPMPVVPNVRAFARIESEFRTTNKL
ncbi:hypothetical protein CEXT_566971 [Caerostris extrusa]|uniref:Uncharacterized protein n=1 Tax=Caerostris extrusa TaxID=172846 RepID=A0AAV4SMK9_CAEEX|nr:hypothetical protein CEXT_566971 [Caerostris extrusa]